MNSVYRLYLGDDPWYTLKMMYQKIQLLWHHAFDLMP